MKDPREFCTCTDTKCPNHPVNHEQGCSLCILKNLSRKEIPACFFKSIDHEKPTKDWYYEKLVSVEDDWLTENGLDVGFEWPAGV